MGIVNMFMCLFMVLVSVVLDIDVIFGGCFNFGLGIGFQCMNEEWFVVLYGKLVIKVKELIVLL